MLCVADILPLFSAVADIADKLGDGFPLYSTGLKGNDASPLKGTVTLCRPYPLSLIYLQDRAGLCDLVTLRGGSVTTGTRRLSEL